MRAASSSSNNYTGEDITAGARQTQDFEWTFNVSDLREGVIENTHVVIFVTKLEDNGNYIVNNIIKCNINDSVGFEYM
ncbi:MAG: hypothetical protein IAB93_07150 [Bacteroidetes bacterium]|uniref:Uncharacterized protein n=1 Tax=Candidatus Merdivivens pullistercoris TaxID=2840873 RepID=A0A9D9N9S5_9BACT|nr:hypothetical protein [Candidatus Merdivivens pullistercoris]